MKICHRPDREHSRLLAKKTCSCDAYGSFSFQCCLHWWIAKKRQYLVIRGNVLSRIRNFLTKGKLQLAQMSPKMKNFNSLLVCYRNQFYLLLIYLFRSLTLEATQRGNLKSAFYLMILSSGINSISTLSEREG